MNITTRNNIITVVLAVLIVFLSWYLYRSIVDPYQVVVEEQEMVERERHRMGLVRDVLVQYRSRKGHFPPTEGGLDSLVTFLKTDSLMVAIAENTYEELPPSTFNPDSLTYSPRPPHNRFEYTVNDTIRPPLYLLVNPDTGDRIGDLERTTLLNVPSWN
ncbi:MAG TPA: hypothetical protein VK040_09485 [Balneolaceae bacterium]|nr:hypothetical protein [Balneolaceae bacterium]